MRAHHVNFRYILLEDGKEYFLLDKLPTLWGYFFPYLNWFSNRTLYRLTESQFGKSECVKNIGWRHL